MITDYKWLIWDGIALLLIIVMIWSAANRGMLRTLVGFVGGIVSATVAGILSTTLSTFLYNTVVRDAIRAVVSRQLAQALENGVAQEVGWKSVIPGWVSGMLPTDIALDMPKTAADVIPAVEQVIDAALAQPVQVLLRGLCFFVLFSVLLLLIRYIARMLSLVDRIPLVGPLNTVMGGVLGAGQAMVVLYLLAVLAQVYIAASGGGGEYLNDQVLSDGYLFGFFYRL